MTTLSELCGLTTDMSKAADDMLRMIVLGAQVVVEMASASATVCVAPAKSQKWIRLLQVLIDTMVCDAESASKHAGRLGFAVTVAADKVGRAFTKPFYAQAISPMAGNRVSL